MANTSKKQWIKKHLSDIYVQMAEKHGYRSRAAFKLLEIEKKNKILKPGLSVLDIGAAPGSWSQIVSEKNKNIKKNRPKLVAIDLLPIIPIEGITTLQGDFSKDSIKKQITEIFKGKKIDLILSDLSPTLTGIKIVDSSKINEFGEMVLDFCKAHLSKNGIILMKTFQGNGHSELISSFNKVFSHVGKDKPSSSRSESAEVFVLAKNLLN